MIINSLLDTDLYKLTMMQWVYFNAPKLKVKYAFNRRCGSNNTLFSNKVKTEIEHLNTLKFSRDELNYLATFPYFRYDFLHFLETFKLNSKNITFGHDELTIYGTWLDTILFEVPILAIINESYNNTNHDMQHAYDKLEYKCTLLNSTEREINIVDFGTRRRFSADWHDKVVSILSKNHNFNFATSNVHMAMKHGITPIGTMAHEYLMVHQSPILCDELSNFQRDALYKWISFYEGRLGIALTDTVGIDAFLRDFNGYLARAYDGVRHDSGDPFEWGHKVLKHYESLGINVTHKTLVFSDGLDVPTCIRLQKEFLGINTVFGIGTNLTNNVGLPTLQIVMKIVEVEGQPVAKLSDSSGKQSCTDAQYLNKLKVTFDR